MHLAKAERQIEFMQKNTRRLQSEQYNVLSWQSSAHDIVIFGVIKNP